MTFTLLPAVDVVDGQAVRLDQGAAGTEKNYGTPREAALKWQEQGASWLHFVDLDAAGCQRFVVTDVTKDGTLEGPNVELLREVAAATEAKITASGGISSLDDLRELALYENEGIDSAIVGKALYEQRFSLEEAIAAVAEVEPLPEEDYIDPIDTY